MNYYKKRRINSIIKCWIALLLVFAILLLTLFLKVKPLIFTFAKSKAETILLNAANEAVLNILEEENISYNDISNVTKTEDGTIRGIEIDIEKLNTLKSEISNTLMTLVSKRDRYIINIPIGTLIGSEYTTGIGPDVPFRMQLTETAIVDFENTFESTGINQALHQILIKIDISANILMIGCTQGFTVSTSAVAAQTVIVGTVPDNFTNVIEHPGDDIADEIFNYADVG